MPRQQTRKPKVGDHVLIGRMATLPTDWLLAKVCWVAGEGVLTEHRPKAPGQSHRKLFEIHDVLAVGTRKALEETKRDAISLLSEEIHALEQAEIRVSKLAADERRLMHDLNRLTDEQVEASESAARRRSQALARMRELGLPRKTGAR